MAANLHSYSAVLARRWPVMLPAIVLVPAVALLLSLGQAKTYSATSQVLLSYDNPVASLNGLAGPAAGVAPDRIISTQAAVARDPVVVQQALSLSRVHSSPQALLARSSVSTLTNADLLQFSVRDSHPASAARLATNYALAYITYRRQLDSQAINGAIADVSRRLSQLAREGQAATTTYRALEHEQQVLTATQAAGSNDAQLVQPADGSAQVTPRPTRNFAIGLGLGLALALGLAFLMEAIDRPVDSVEEMERRLGLPLLARIPAPTRWRVGLGRVAALRESIRAFGRRLRLALGSPHPLGSTRSAPVVSPNWQRSRVRGVDSVGPGASDQPNAAPLRQAASSGWPDFRSGLAILRSGTAVSDRSRGVSTLAALGDQHGREAEAFRVLTSSLEFASLEHDFKSVAVTCGCDYRGKPATIANLGVTLALSGRRVLLCDLDGRGRGIGDLFALQARPGVTDVVLDHAGLDEAVASIPVPPPVSWHRNGEGAETLPEIVVGETSFLTNPEERLGVLPFGGALLPNSGFLGSRAVTDLVQELKNAQLDLLLIDTPPLLASGDARSLSARADAVIVALASPVRAPVLEELARTLSRSPAIPLGFITVGTVSGGYDASPPPYYVEQRSRPGVRPDGHRETRQGATRH
jgi:Mrp family chromosome partitioning ATPase/capsular polysaccharide biosynthesis protein